MQQPINAKSQKHPKTHALEHSFQQAYSELQRHGMPTIAQPLQIAVPDALNVLTSAFAFVLAKQHIPFAWQAEYEKVAHWLSNNQGKGLLLYGDCGRGKTVLTRHVLPLILLHSCQKVMNVYDVQQMNQRLDELLTKHIIALDDIGTEEAINNYGNKRVAFAEIMDRAEKQGKLLVISTNLNADGLEERYGERVFERIVACTQHIRFEGESLRR